MFNGVKIYIISLSFVIVLSSCLSDGSNTEGQVVNNDSIKAEELLQEANLLYEKSEFAESIARINLIDSIYKKQIVVRRKSMALKPRVMEGLIMKDIVKIDSMLADGQSKQLPANEMHKLLLQKEKLEKQLQVARNQKLRLSE